MKNIRKILRDWNIAPLTIVAIFCYFSYWILSVLLAIPPCEDPTAASVAFMGALTTAFAGTTVILHKMYNSLQKNNEVVDENE